MGIKNILNRIIDPHYRRVTDKYLAGLETEEERAELRDNHLSPVSRKKLIEESEYIDDHQYFTGITGYFTRKHEGKIDLFER